MRIFSKEHRLKLSEANRKKWGDPKYKIRVGQRIRESYTPELRKQRSDSTKEDWEQNSERRMKQSFRQKGRRYSEETKKKISSSKLTNSFSIAKKQILEERGNFCQRCGKNEKLIIHHMNGMQWDNDKKNLLILCKSCHSRIHIELGKHTRGFAGLATVQNYISKILKSLGVNLDHPDWKETPLRVSRTYNEFFEGFSINGKEEIEQIFASKFPSSNDEMIIQKGIEVFTLCPHHLLPIEYLISVGYIPTKNVVGLSKLPRLIELLSKKPDLQENITVQIGKQIEKNLGTKGVMVVVSGEHYCMKMRGVKKNGIKVFTSYISGVFKKQGNGTRSEFLQLINQNNG